MGAEPAPSTCDRSPAGGVVPVYVINVDAHTGRLQKISARAMALGMEIVRWPATTESELDAATLYCGELADGVRIRDFAPWSGNEAACGISHIRLLRRFVSSGHPWAVVLEDDAFIAGAVPTHIAEWNLPPDAEIVLLNDRSTAGSLEVVTARFAYGEVVGGAGTDGYLISSLGARKLLRVLDPLKDPLDFQMYAHFASVRRSDRPPFFWRLPRNVTADDVELTAYRIEPPLIEHRDGDSVIGNARHPRARFYCRVLLGLEFDDDGTVYRYPYPPAVIPAPPAPGDDAGRRFFRGVDISHLRTGGWPREPARRLGGHPLDLMAQAGVDAVRISAWVDASTPFATERVLAVAREAAERDLDLCVALHYSDTWADPGLQARPAAWRGLRPPALRDAVSAYTYGVISALCRQGTPPSVVQIGNEITNGMLWADPDQDGSQGGQLWRPESDGTSLDYDRQWEVFARLARTAVSAARTAASDWDSAVEVMVHIDTGAQVEQAEWWLRRARGHGIDFDLAGLSFYPMWHDGATIQAIEALGLLSVTLPDVGIVLAETAFPYRAPTDVAVTRQLEFPITPAGQHAFLSATLRALRALPTGRGVFWWGAFFVDGADCHRVHALLDDRGQPVPALAAFVDH